MPIRRVAATSLQEKEKASSIAEEKEPDATPEESPSADEEEAASSTAAAEEEDEGEAADETEPTENGEEADEGVAAEKTEEEEAEKKDDKCNDCAARHCTTHCFVLLPRLKDGYKYEKGKVKKVKRTIPAWASVTRSKKVPVTNFTGTKTKIDDILIEAIQASNEKSGVSYQSVMKYLVKKYPGLELERRKFLIKKALKKHLEKGTIKQLKGKGLSGRFAIGKQPASSKKATAKTGSLGDALPLIITRLCEPKEASFLVIKKYLEQYFPSLDIENRPEILKMALGKAVEKGQLEQITGKGARGTFQLKRTGNQILLKGGAIEDAITAAITAMNEPKTCSTTILRKYLLDAHKDSSAKYLLVASLKRILTKCKVLGWMEQISGHGFNGTYQLSFPFYPSPMTLDPVKFKETPKKKVDAPKRKLTVDSSDEEESDEESESEDEAPRRKKPKKRPPPKARHPVPAKKSKSASRSKAKGKTSNKSPAKKVAPSAMKNASKGRKSAATKKKSTPLRKSTPVKRAAPAKKSKTPAVKKLTKKGGKQPAPKESSHEEPTVEKRVTKSKSKLPEPEKPSSDVPAARRGSKQSKSKESSPKQPTAKKGAKGRKQSTCKSKRGEKLSPE